jgi:hypothetical protein
VIENVLNFTVVLPDVEDEQKEEHLMYNSEKWLLHWPYSQSQMSNYPHNEKKLGYVMIAMLLSNSSLVTTQK